MSAAVLRCCCRRHAGGVTYLRVTDFLDEHQFNPGEVILERDVTVIESRDRHAEILLLPPRPISIFANETGDDL